METRRRFEVKDRAWIDCPLPNRLYDAYLQDDNRVGTVKSARICSKGYWLKMDKPVKKLNCLPHMIPSDIPRYYAFYVFNPQHLKFTPGGKKIKIAKLELQLAKSREETKEIEKHIAELKN